MYRCFSKKTVTGSNGYTIRYLYDDNNLLVGFIYNNETYYYQRTLTGDIARIVDEAGEIKGEYIYDAYGNILNIDNLSEIAEINPFRYKGYYYDQETNLYYCKSRYYSPEIYRWLSRDAIEYLDTSSVEGCNLYVYCNNNPIMYVDENGHDAIYVSLYSWKDGGLPIVGHAKLYYQDEYGNWRCTEYTGEKPRDAIVCDYFVTFYTKDLLNMLATMDCDYKYLEGNFSSIKEYADGFIGLNYGGYNVFKRNCLHYVKDALRYSGVNIFMSDTFIPKNFKPVIIKYGSGGGMPLIGNRNIVSGIGGMALLYCYEKTNSFNLLMNNFI